MGGGEHHRRRGTENPKARVPRERDEGASDLEMLIPAWNHEWQMCLFFSAYEGQKKVMRSEHDIKRCCKYNSNECQEGETSKQKILLKKKGGVPWRSSPRPTGFCLSFPAKMMSFVPKNILGS